MGFCYSACVKTGTTLTKTIATTTKIEQIILNHFLPEVEQAVSRIVASSLIQ
jgi:cobalt-zinc-cadmium resistance protein CzcA